MPKKTRSLASVGLGFRVHSGWAAVVAVKGPASSPAVVDRRRIELADPEIRSSLQPFHAAAELDPAPAEELIKQRADSTNALALQSLRLLIDNLCQLGLPVTGIKEREILNRGVAELGFSLEEIQGRMLELGRAIGPPWRQDEKLATLAAWLILAAA
jgi:hypothetical protein